MYGYATKHKPETESRIITGETRLSPAPVSPAARPVIFERSIHSRILPAVPIIQCIREDQLQNPEGTRHITISRKETLRRTGETVPPSSHSILAGGLFQEARSSKVSELTATADGEQYLQLGWDNCILLHRIDGKYQEAGNWRMDHPPGAPDEEQEKIAVPAKIRQGDSLISHGQAVDALITWSVSSCEVVILVSSNKNFIAMMHINNDIPLPTDEFAEIRWQTAFISIFDNEKEIGRTRVLLDALHLSDIRVLDRKFIREDGKHDAGSDSLNYIGLKLSEEAGPQIFGSQGCLEGELTRLFDTILTYPTWKEAKNGVLQKFYSLTEYLDDFLRSMTSPPPLPDETPQRRETLLEQNFKKIKEEAQSNGPFFRQFQAVFLGIAGEQGFQIRL